MLLTISTLLRLTAIILPDLIKSRPISTHGQEVFVRSEPMSDAEEENYKQLGATKYLQRPVLDPRG